MRTAAERPPFPFSGVTEWRKKAVGSDHRDRDRERTTVIKEREREPHETTVIKEHDREPDRKVIIDRDRN